MKRRLRPKCRCGKIHSADLDEARKTKAEIWAERGGAVECRFYECQYRAWHWTRELDPNYHQQSKAAA